MGSPVTLYLWSLQASSKDLARFNSTLCTEEVARRDRFVFPRDRDAFVVARGGLRESLGRLTGRSARDLTFHYGPQGKPALQDGPFFNLSHSGGLACLAVQDDFEVGVDIEAMRPVEGDIAARFFSAAENKALKALPDADRTDGFFRCWTRKEAVIKALGGGLSIPLTDFDVSLRSDQARLQRIAPTHGDAAEWAMAAFKCGADMWGAVAAKTGGHPITLEIKRCPKGVSVLV